MTNRLRLAFLLVALASLAAKLALSRLGANTDVYAWMSAGDAVWEGQRLYVEKIWNYGPVWYWGAAGLRLFQGRVLGWDDVGSFHLMIAGFLGLVDIATAWILSTRIAPWAGLFFLLNPVSILITGYHSQVENLVILLGLFAVLIWRRELGPDLSRPVGPRFHLQVAGLLALSLLAKHVLVLVPLWLALQLIVSRRRVDRDSVGILVLPPLLAFVGFLPWLLDPARRPGIMTHVVRYASVGGNGLLTKLLGIVVPPDTIHLLSGAEGVLRFYKLAFAVAMLLAGLAFARRERDPLRLFAAYGLCMVVFSPALANQYLAIPLIAVALAPKSPFTWGFTILSTAWLLISPENVGSVTHLAENPVVASLGLGQWNGVFFLFLFLVVDWARRPPVHHEAVAAH